MPRGRRDDRTIVPGRIGEWNLRLSGGDIDALERALSRVLEESPDDHDADRLRRISDALWGFVSKWKE